MLGTSTAWLSARRTRRSVKGATSWRQPRYVYEVLSAVSTLRPAVCLRRPTSVSGGVSLRAAPPQRRPRKRTNASGVNPENNPVSARPAPRYLFVASLTSRPVPPPPPHL